MAACLTGRFDRALLRARDIHDGDLRKGTPVPYFAHLMGVAGIVLDAGGDEDQAIAALLHDALEDHPEKASHESLELEFSQRVADIVLGCSDTVEHPKPGWLKRKQDYLAKLLVKPAETLLVSAADKLHNARAIRADHRLIGDELWTRFNKDSDQGWYYVSLLTVFVQRSRELPWSLVDELENTIEAVPWKETPRLAEARGLLQQAKDARLAGSR